MCLLDTNKTSEEKEISETDELDLTGLDDAELDKVCDQHSRGSNSLH